MSAPGPSSALGVGETVEGRVDRQLREAKEELKAAEGQVVKYEARLEKNEELAEVKARLAAIKRELGSASEDEKLKLEAERKDLKDQEAAIERPLTDAYASFRIAQNVVDSLSQRLITLSTAGAQRGAVV